MPKRKHVKKKKREIVFISLGKIFLRVVENGSTWCKLEPKTKIKIKSKKIKNQNLNFVIVFNLSQSASISYYSES